MPLTSARVSLLATSPYGDEELTCFPRERRRNTITSHICKFALKDGF